MSFHAIAYGPDEHVLLTLDGGDLLAHDAHTEAPKWHLSFDLPLVAALFVDAGALPGGAAAGGASPWRSASSGRCVAVVDSAGGVHAVDHGIGAKTGAHGPFGKPVAVAAGTGGLLALATEETVLLWRSGEQTEIAARASALAFSNDGATLAIGSSDGSLRFLSVSGGPSTAPVETFCAVVHGGVSDLVHHPAGAWIVGGKSGLTMVTDAGPRRLESLPTGIVRVRLDAAGNRLAAQLSERAIAVYSWPALAVEQRIEYLERPVRGLSFGDANWIGIALDHGDGNKIDVVTSAAHRTDTHPGRTHRSWLLNVRGKEAVFSAKEAEDVRRMKDPFHAPAPQKGNNSGRIGIGVGITLAVLCVRLCAAGSRSSYSAPTYDPYLYTPPALPTSTVPRLPAKHATLIILQGPTLESSTEEISLANVGESEEPGAIWAAPDGTVFVVTKTDQNRSHVHRRDGAGDWDVIARRRTPTIAQLWGRSATDLYIMDYNSLAHFDGKRLHEIEPPSTKVFALGGIGDDVFLANLPAADAESDDALGPMQVHRRRGPEGTWTQEKIADGLAVQELWSGGGQLFARVLAKDGEDGIDDRLLQRTANGKWTERNWWFAGNRPATAAIRAVWVSPTSDAFVATNLGIYRSANGGASWSKTGAQSDVQNLWGRSNGDVYATTGSGLLHYDGKTWTTTTAFTKRAGAIGGTKTHVFLSVSSY